MPSSSPRKATKELILQEPSSFFREERSWCSSVSLHPPRSLSQPRPASGVLQTPPSAAELWEASVQHPHPVYSAGASLASLPLCRAGRPLLVAFLHLGLLFSKPHISLRGRKGRLSQARSRTPMLPSQPAAWLQLLSKPARPAPAANRDQHQPQPCAGKLPQA